MSGFIQQVLQDIAPFFEANITASHNASSPIAPSSIPSIPSDLTSLLTLLFSFGALRDWLKLIVIGGVLETCRRTILSVYESILDSFYIRASFDQEDDCYRTCHSIPTLRFSNNISLYVEWMLVWLSKQPSWCTFSSPSDPRPSALISCSFSQSTEFRNRHSLRH